MMNCRIANSGLILGYRRRRTPNMTPALDQTFVSAGLGLLKERIWQTKELTHERSTKWHNELVHLWTIKGLRTL